MRSNLEKGMTKEILGKYADDDFTRRKRNAPPYGVLDENGIPLCDVRRRFGLNSPPVYHPVMTAQYALAQYNLTLEGNSEAEAIFMRCARSLEDNAVEEPQQRFLVWPYRYLLRTPPVPAGWISGMAQGEGLSVLARSFQKTGSSRTAEVAERVAKSFLYTVEEGGVIFRLSSKSCFIEEIAHPPFIHILNGCQIALMGLFEHLQLFSDPKVQKVLEASVQGIEELLPQFDTGYWSLYSLGYRWDIASRHYHHVHVRLFRDLGKLLNNAQFSNYAGKWEKYEMSTANRFRHDTTEFLQVNARRALTVLRLNSLKYRTPFPPPIASGI
jgi:heparosan-N-sulfate-glucuronate 5-epimerase